MSGPTIPINGRVDPKQICRVALYMKKMGYKPVNKSEVVRFTFDMAEAFMERLDPTDFQVENNHEALDYLNSLGLKWPGKESKKAVMRTLQYDTLQDMTPEQVEEVNAFAKTLKGKSTKEQLMDQIPSEDDLEEQLLEELREVEREKQRKINNKNNNDGEDYAN